MYRFLSSFRVSTKEVLYVDSTGRAAEFDYTVQLDRELPVEFICSKTESYEDGVILEGHDLTRAHSSEMMLASYSKMIEEKTKELEAAIQARISSFQQCLMN